MNGIGLCSFSIDLFYFYSHWLRTPLWEFDIQIFLTLLRPLSRSLTLCLQAGCKFGGNFMLLILKIDSLSIHLELFSFIHIACCLAYPWYICYAYMTAVPYWYKMYFVCWFIHHVVEGFFSSSFLVYFLLCLLYMEPVNHWAQSSTRNAIIW